tara:strand:- start:4407 stop:4622 length:216 start_codon:yes stop_codon:yes gene_type:complete
MEISPASTNQKILLDIQYQVKELNSSVNALKYEIQFIKSNLHTKPIDIEKTKNDIVIVEEEEPIKSWFWNS